MKKAYMIIKTNNDSIFLLDSIKTSQSKAWDRRNELIKDGYRVKVIDVLTNEDDINEILNSTNFMAGDAEIYSK